MEVPQDSGRTILDYLKADYWRPVLNYLSLEDIVRSERVSRRWQRIVNHYLESVRIRMQYRRFQHGETRDRNCRILTLDNADPEIYEKMTRKLGPLVVASDCINRASYWSITKNCPNIESVTISGKLETQLMHSQVTNFKSLKRLAFKRCRFSGVLEGNDFYADIPDYFIKKYLESETLEELKIYNNTQVNGTCLSALKHKLKSLYFINCQKLSINALLDNVDCLSELTKLELNGNPPEILQNVHLLLDQMPNLEQLSLSTYKETKLSRSVIKSISKLDRLKHFCVKENQNVTDEWLRAVAMGCKKLQTVDIGKCQDKIPIGQRKTPWVTPEGVLALCKSLSPTLTVLGVAYNLYLSNKDLADCISACPYLTTVDLQGRIDRIRGLVDKAERAARGRPQFLRLRLYSPYSSLSGEERYGRLLLDFDPHE